MRPGPLLWIGLGYLIVCFAGFWATAFVDPWLLFEDWYFALWIVAAPIVALVTGFAAVWRSRP